MYTRQISHEGFLCFGFSEQEKSQWQNKLRVTLPKIQTDYRRSFSYLVKYLEMRKNEGKADSLVRTACRYVSFPTGKRALVGFIKTNIKPSEALIKDLWNSINRQLNE